jgi:hypothetical protein
MKHRTFDEWSARVVLVISITFALAPPARAQEGSHSGPAMLQDDPRAAASPGEPTDADRASASAHFRRGVELHSEGDYDAALVEFQRAYDAVPDYRVLYNVGVTYLAQRSYVLALRAFERYLVLGGAEIDPARRAQVEQDIASLRERVGFLVLRTNVDGAEIRVDGEVVGRSPMSAPLSLDVGRHRVEVSAVGHQPAQRTISMAGGDELDLAIELEPVPVVAAPTPTEPLATPTPPEPEHRNLRPLAIGGFITTAIVAAAAGATGGLALKSHNDYEDAAGTYPGDAQAIADASDRTHTLSVVTDALAGTALALGCTSLIVILVDRKHHRDEDRVGRVDVSLGPLGGSIRGRF